MNKFQKLAAASLFAAFAVPASNAFAVDEHFIGDAAVVGGYDLSLIHI